MWFLGSFYVVTRFFISKQHLVLDKICQMKDICHQYYILNRNKKSHGPENHCGYMISLGLVKPPFVKSISKVPDLAKTKVLYLSPSLSQKLG